MPWMFCTIAYRSKNEIIHPPKAISSILGWRLDIYLAYIILDPLLVSLNDTADGSFLYKNFFTKNVHLIIECHTLKELLLTVSSQSSTIPKL